MLNKIYIGLSYAFHPINIRISEDTEVILKDLYIITVYTVFTGHIEFQNFLFGHVLTYRVENVDYTVEVELVDIAVACHIQRLKEDIIYYFPVIDRDPAVAVHVNTREERITHRFSA